jgi:hypothetical protein
MGLTKSTVFHTAKQALAKTMLFNKPYPPNLPNPCKANAHAAFSLPTKF